MIHKRVVGLRPHSSGRGKKGERGKQANQAVDLLQFSLQPMFSLLRIPVFAGNFEGFLGSFPIDMSIRE
jgi:hypothetical protein